MKDLLLIKEPDGTCRLRIKLGDERPVVKCLTQDGNTVDGKYETLLGINAANEPVYMRIENIGAIDAVFLKACEKAIPSPETKPPPFELDEETEGHIGSFCLNLADQMIETWLKTSADQTKSAR